MDVVTKSLERDPLSYDANKLIDAYTQPSRHYHNMMHIWHLLTDIKSVPDLDDTDRHDLEIVAWWHDFVYVPGWPDNEERSAAAFLNSTSAAWLSGVSVRIINTAILATKTHLPTHDPVVDLFLDLDLRGLGASPYIYEINRRNVRAEFGSFSDKEWAVGRRKFIESMLDRPTIYHTEFGRRLEANARVNLHAELGLLGG